MSADNSAPQQSSSTSQRQRGATERRPYSDGLAALKSRVKVRGLQAIDMRTAAARELIAWRNELIADIGGDEVVSAQQRALVAMTRDTALFERGAALSRGWSAPRIQRVLLPAKYVATTASFTSGIRC